MLKVIIYSLLSLVLLFFVARSCGVTPAQIEDARLLAELNAQEGAAYRQARAAHAGVVSLPNGLLVQVLRAGDGELPTADDWVQVHYRGWRVDGREFENSWRADEPAVLPIDRAIPGWQQALLATPVGTRLRMVLPPELAYGQAGSGLIGPEETLEFELELLAIVVPEAPVERAQWEQPVPNLN